MAKPLPEKTVKQIHFPLAPKDVQRLEDAAARGFRPVAQQARLAVLAWLDGDDAARAALSALHEGEGGRKRRAGAR